LPYTVSKKQHKDKTAFGRLH